MKAAIYCRLSREDDEKQLESESILNQKKMLLNYAQTQKWIIYDIFCDEDYSGADAARPAFCRLLQEAEQKKFDIVLCKTQSRFTRDMELVEKYIHGKFPQWGIRFVAVVDNVDTEIRGNKKARQISGLMNEWYLEDLSENIRAVFDMKRREGQYIGSFPIYGYQKAPENKNQLIVDPKAAEIVRKIFSLYLAGNGRQHIARLLNAANVPNPTRYKQLQGLHYINGAEKDKLGLWNATTVGRILREQMYTGDLIQGRRKKASYKSKALLTVPVQDWIIVPQTHEAIIDHETFETAKRLLKERTRSAGTGEVHPLAGKVRCMDCGSAMVKVSNVYRGVRHSYLRCKLYAADKNRCTSHSVRLDSLEEQIAALLRRRLCGELDKKCIEGILAGVREEKDAFLQQCQRLQDAVKLRERAAQTLYLDKVRGVIAEDQFLQMNIRFSEEKERLERRIAELQHQISGAPSQKQNDQAKALETLFALPQLSRALVGTLIDTIEIGERDAASGTQKVKIHWLV